MFEQVINPTLGSATEESIPTVESVHMHAQELADTIDLLENSPGNDTEAANYQRTFELKQQIKNELSALGISSELPEFAAKTSVYNESLTLTELILDVTCVKIEAMEVSGAMRAFVKQEFDVKAGEFYKKFEKRMQRQSLIRGDLEIPEPRHDKPQISHRFSSVETVTNLDSDNDAEAANEIPRLILTGRIEPVYADKQPRRSRILNFLKNASNERLPLDASIQNKKTPEHLTRTNRLTKRIAGFIGAAALSGSAGLALGIEVGTRLNLL